MLDVAKIADVFARNEIATSNEIRQAIGWVPSKDSKADELQNSNMPQSANVIDSTAEEETDLGPIVDQLGLTGGNQDETV